MARKTEDRIQRLKQLRTAEADGEAASILIDALEDKSGLVVAEAAKVIGDQQRAPLIPNLLAAYSRMFQNPVQSDPKCRAKTSILKALTVLDFEEAAPFLRASTYVQMEPVWGGQEDSAPQLRACAILALVQCTDLPRTEILRHLVDALADKSDTVRVEAVRALEQMNGEESALLLRLKAHAGDSRSVVLGQVFDSILILEGDRTVEFVAQFLKSQNEEVRDEAALSLGASRLPGAVRLLIDAWQSSREPLLLRALSSSRAEAALAFLLDVVREGITRDMTAALEALQLHAESPEIQAQVDEARSQRGRGA